MIDQGQMQCTWSEKDTQCNGDGSHQQLDRDGKTWAHLCDDHAQMLKDGFASADARRIVSCWAKANGGSKKLVERMQPSINVASKVFAAMLKRSKARVT